MEEGLCPLYMGSRRFPSETEVEVALCSCFMTYSSLYIAKLPLSSVLTAIGKVTCATYGWLFFKAKGG